MELTNNSTDINSLETLKRSLVEIGEGLTPSQVREETAIAETKKQLNLARRLTAFVYSDSVKTFFCNRRNLCLGMLRNANKAAILRKIVTRHLTGEENQIYLQYHHDIGYSFYHSAKHFAAELFISVSTVYKLIKDLAAEGWIEIYHKQDVFGRKIYHLKLKIENFIRRAEIYMQSHLSFFDKRIYQNLPNDSYINKQKKEINNIEQEENFSDQRNSTTDPIRIENRSVEAKSENVESSYLDCPEEINVPRVDEKINSKPVLKSEQARSWAMPRQATCSRKDMAKHSPQGDRFFQVRSQKLEVRSRAKMESCRGMSGFKDVEDLRECQKQLTGYFAKQMEPVKAAEKASWIIKAERQGERSPFVQDFLDGVAIGSWCKKEWEIEPGVIFPVFRGYLLNKLRRGEDTREQINVKISWFLKDLKATEDAWAECKRLVDIEQPRLIQAIQRGQDIHNSNIPHWIIDSYRPEIPIEQVSGTAEILSKAAIAYNETVKSHQNSLTPKLEDIPELPLDSPIRKLLEKYNCQPENDLEKRAAVDTVMDEVVISDAIATNFPMSEEEEAAKVSTELLNEIDLLLSDPITRPRGIRLAKQQNLPLLLNTDGVAIGIDRSDGDNSGVENYQAHQIYQPEQIEKGSKSAWEEAKAKSKFLSKRAKSGNR